MFLASAVTTAAGRADEPTVDHTNRASSIAGVITIVPTVELPIALTGMLAVITPAPATAAELISGVAVKAGIPAVVLAVVQPVKVPVSCAQIATAAFSESRLDKPEAAFDLDV